jgi:minichromosome maintenance protein 10
MLLRKSKLPNYNQSTMFNSKPQVSSERLKILMEGRRLIRLSVLHQKVRGVDIDGDWVTMAVIVSKSEPKVSAKV